MSNLTPERREQINRHLHTIVMGKCWHDFDDGREMEIPKCRKCGVCHFPFNGDEEQPDYTSSESPRRLLEEVVEEVIKSDPGIAYRFYELCRAYGPLDGQDVSLKAEQIAEACYEATKEGI